MSDGPPRIYANGAVFAGVRDRPWIDAVAVHGGRIVVAGRLAEVRAAAPGADEVDLEGGTLLPGLIDAHNHFLSTGESLASLDLRYPAVDSVGSLLALIREAAAEAEPGATLSGFGFDDARYALPTLTGLDAAAGDHPLQLFHISGHHVLANSAVLRAAGLGDDTPDPPGAGSCGTPPDTSRACASTPRAARWCRPTSTWGRTARTSMPARRSRTSCARSSAPATRTWAPTSRASPTPR